MTRVFCVFTGDLIASRATPGAIDGSIARLSFAAQAFEATHDTALKFTRNRGDGWQVLLERPELAFDLYLHLMAHLRAGEGALGTTLGIGAGPIDTPGTRDLSDAAGEAFVIAADMLSGLNTPAHPQLAEIGGAPVQDWQRGVLRMADWIVTGWTRPQAEAAALALTRPDATNAARAQTLGITRQAFEARLKGAGLAALAPARAAFAAHRFGGAA